MNKLAAILGGLLFVSLAGNLFMGGLMLGHRASVVETPSPGAVSSVQSSEDRRAEWRKRDQMLRERLSEADRAIFEEIKQKYHDQIEQKRIALDQARERLEEAQSAEIIDTPAIEEAGREEAVRRAEFLQAIRAARKEISGRLSPEGRIQMERLRPPKGKRPGGRGRDWPHSHDNAPSDGERGLPQPPAGAADLRYVQPQANQPETPNPPGDCGACEVPGAGSPADGAPPQP
ncbi:MAG TPA: periplasmic heavy metal sensor [Patescibacteria group bacterium]|nr:periplasmic heavy metal sensor [Patescibacteria group bacterium]